MDKRQAKKSETLEVRLSHEAKAALMRKVQAEGRSASDVVRQSIEAYLAEQPKEARPMLLNIWKPAAAAGALSIAIFWTVLAPGPVAAAPDLRAAFATFDRNKDEILTVDEFLGHSADALYVMNKNQPGAGSSSKPFILPLRRQLPAPPPGASTPPDQMLRDEFRKHDSDHDGSVTFAEFEQFHRAVFREGFEAVDSDGDGAVDRKEFASATRNAPAGPATASFAEIDADGDGRISRDEFFS